MLCNVLGRARQISTHLKKCFLVLVVGCCSEFGIEYGMVVGVMLVFMGRWCAVLGSEVGSVCLGSCTYGRECFHVFWLILCVLFMCEVSRKMSSWNGGRPRLGSN